MVLLRALCVLFLLGATAACDGLARDDDPCRDDILLSQTISVAVINEQLVIHQKYVLCKPLPDVIPALDAAGPSGTRVLAEYRRDGPPRVPT